MTIRCPSNGHSASSTSGLLAPAAQSSDGRAACSCLSWPAVMPRRPHHPLLLPPLAMPSLYIHPHLLLFFGDSSLTPQLKQSTHVLPSAWASTVTSSSAPRCPFLGLAVVHRPGALATAWSTWSRNDFHQTWTVRGKGFCISQKKVPPDDRSDPPAISSHARKCLLTTHQKMNIPC